MYNKACCLLPPWTGGQALLKSQLKIAKMNYVGKRCFDLLQLSDKVSFLVSTEAEKYTFKKIHPDNLLPEENPKCGRLKK